jgi:dTDP-4-amino-4,6-dideoxygalactose transaminase
MYIPTFQGLTPADFLKLPGRRATRFPFDVPHLSFYRARNAIYFLARSVKTRRPRLTVLVPDYNSGNEILALQAAGAELRYYAVGADGQLDPSEVEALCDRHRPDVLYVIHYLGWPQPIRRLSELCRRSGIAMIEDCALSLLSDTGTQPIGTQGDFSVFCLYKTLPLPNGACLVQNGDAHLGRVDMVQPQMREAGAPSVLGRTAELVLRRMRSRSDLLGQAMQSMKSMAGRAMGAMEIARANVGDLGFNPDETDLAMSAVSLRLLERLDVHWIRERRIANYRMLHELLNGVVTPLHDELPDGVCPLFYPILVDDKRAFADDVRAHGIDALEFWNHGADQTDRPKPPDEGPHARFLRAHVVGLPIHQDLTTRHIEYVAERIAHLGDHRAN